MAVTYEILDEAQLPPGITFDGTSIISGTSTAAGAFSFDVKKLIDGVPQYTFSVDFLVYEAPVTIPPPTPPPVTIPPPPTPPCSTATIRGVAGGTSPAGDFQYTPPAFTPAASSYNYTGTLPSGCTFDPGTGAVVGGCTTPGTYNMQIYAGDAPPIGPYIDITWIIDDINAPTADTPYCFTQHTATLDPDTCTWGPTTITDGPRYGTPAVGVIPLNTWYPDLLSTPCGAIYIATVPTYGFAFVGSGCGTLDNGIPCSIPIEPDPSVEVALPTGIDGCMCSMTPPPITDPP